MKKGIIVSLFFFVACAISFAQNQHSKHLSFRGIPLDGPISSFTERMKEIGYEEKVSGNEDFKKCFTGVFIGKSSTIYVSFSPSGVVYRVDVLQYNDSQSGVYASIKEIRELYTSKYGRAESFDNVHTWTVDYGGIVVMPDTSTPSVRIVYEDEKNAEKAFKEKERQNYTKKKQYLDEI